MRLDALLSGLSVLCLGCASVPTNGATPSGSETEGPQTARIVLLGDVMLGRSVAPVVANDRDSIFEPIRATLAGADLALANLESPLTERPHLVGITRWRPTR